MTDNSSSRFNFCNENYAGCVYVSFTLICTNNGSLLNAFVYFPLL